MNLNRVKILDHNKYLTRYKIVSPGQFAIYLNEDIEAAGVFEDDDFIIEMCKRDFKKVEVEKVGELFPEDEENVPEENLELLNWM